MFTIFSFSHLDYCHLDSADKALATNHLRHKSKMSPGKVNFWKWSNRVVNHYWREMSNASFDNWFVMIWPYKVFHGYLWKVNICGTNANIKIISRFCEMFFFCLLLSRHLVVARQGLHTGLVRSTNQALNFFIIFQLDPIFFSLEVLQRTEDIST